MRNDGTAMWSLAMNSHFAPEAMYWRAVARYKATNDHAVLGKVAEELRNTYPSSLWTSKSIPWLH